MNRIVGTWDVSMRTPIGTVRATMTFEDDNGVLIGVAEGRGERILLRDIHSEVGQEATQVRWAQTITKPMRLELLFDVTITGDEMAGISRAGKLPKSAVSGRRAAG